MALKPKTVSLSLAMSVGMVVESAAGLDWRLDAQWEAIRQEQVEAAPLALVEAENFSWSERYDLSLSGNGAGLDLRFEPANRGSAESEWSVRQAYYDGGLADYEVTLGQKHLHWDYGFLANPLNWVGPGDGRAEYLAEPLVSVQQFRGINTDQVVCTLRLNNRRELCLVRTQGFTGGLDWQLVAGYQEGGQLGAGGSWVPGRHWEYHGSLAWYQTALRRRYRDGQLSTAPGSAWNLLVGTSTSGRGGWQLLLEHHLDTRALPAGDWSLLLADLKSRQGTGSAWTLASAWQGEPLTAHRSLARLTQSWNDWDLTGILIGLWADEPTVLTKLELDYSWTQHAQWSLGWQSTPASGLLGRIGQGDAYALSFNWVLAP